MVWMDEKVRRFHLNFYRSSEDIFRYSFRSKNLVISRISEPEGSLSAIARNSFRIKFAYQTLESKVQMFKSLIQISAFQNHLFPLAINDLSYRWPGGVVPYTFYKSRSPLAQTVKLIINDLNKFLSHPSNAFQPNAASFAGLAGPADVTIPQTECAVRIPTLSIRTPERNSLPILLPIQPLGTIRDRWSSKQLTTGIITHAFDYGQWPNRTKITSSFTPSTPAAGHLLVSCKIQRLELRVYGALASSTRKAAPLSQKWFEVRP